MTKKIIITGATGLIGQKLCKALIDRGDEVTIFSRNTSNSEKIITGAKRHIEWNYQDLDSWQNEIENKDAVIHLAGANIFGKRWNAEYKKIILDSRKISTSNLVKAVENAKSKPKVFISSSAVGYYGDNKNEKLTEQNEAGKDFLANVCNVWEKEARQVTKFGVRHVAIRTGIVLSTKDGALKQMLTPFKFFVGGPIGSGKQWFPWIHINDIVKIYLFSLDNESLNGAVNAVSPNPVTMNEFAKKLGKIIHRPSIFSVPEFVLKLVVGEGAESILESLRVQPEKLIKYNFKFDFEDLEAALKHLLK